MIEKIAATRHLVDVHKDSKLVPGERVYIGDMLVCPRCGSNRGTQSSWHGCTTHCSCGLTIKVTGNALLISETYNPDGTPTDAEVARVWDEEGHCLICRHDKVHHPTCSVLVGAEEAYRDL